jgi:hypothetical protein
MYYHSETVKFDIQSTLLGLPLKKKLLQAAGRVGCFEGSADAKKAYACAKEKPLIPTQRFGGCENFEAKRRTRFDVSDDQGGRRQKSIVRWVQEVEERGDIPQEV